MKRVLQLLCTVILSCAFLLLGGCGSSTADKAATDTSSARAEASGNLQVTMLDVGQGDAILVRTDYKTILVDTGDDKYYEDGKKGKINNQLFDALKKENVSAIDTLILTHAHADHIGKADEVIEKYKVKELVYNGIPSANRYFVNALKAAKAQGTQQVKVKAGDTLDFGNGVYFEVLSPTAKLVDEDMKAIKNKEKVEVNNESVVGKLSFGSFSMLLTGDAETPIEKEMLASYGKNMRCQVLKAGHHGSKTSSSLDLLKAVQPEAVLISAGTNNRYGHPHENILTRYQKQGIKNIYRTDKNGNITISSDGKTYKITTEK